MSGVNKVIIIGNLGQDPETRNLPNGGQVANISVATSEKWKDKNTGQPQERTEWHRVVFFNRLAEIAGQYLSKGSKVYVEGQLRTRKWQDNSGQDRYTTEIVAGQMQMLDSRSQGGGQQGGYPESDYQQPLQPQQNQGGGTYGAAHPGAPAQPQPAPPQHQGGGYPGAPAPQQAPHQQTAPQNPYDDDIPF